MSLKKYGSALTKHVSAVKLINPIPQNESPFLVLNFLVNGIVMLKLHKATFSELPLLLLLLFCIPNFAAAQDGRLSGRTVTGTVYFIGGRTAGRSVPFRLVINRVNTAQELSQLNTALQSGQDDLLGSLSKMDAGRIQIGTGVGITANAIFETDLGDGRTRITVLYERNLRFAELRYGSRSQDYRFGYAELYVGRGDNQGMLIPAARVRLRDGNTWEVEDFGTYPARLMGLKVSGGRIS